ncbi:hypothetical protein [Deinococcus puniceus]|uniref:hypothetical protein n=1 Tax=Deinococcus puniceus TaxID=1182568 RepID=UPI000A449ECB|nr:hypothetical protein [Deinococcus puniceus]
MTSDSIYSALILIEGPIERGQPPQQEQDFNSWDELPDAERTIERAENIDSDVD